MSASHSSLWLFAAVMLAGATHADVQPQLVSQADKPLFPGSRLQMWDVERITDDVYGFRYSIYRSAFVVTPEGVMVIDPINPKAAAILREEIRKVTDKPVKFVAYTHSHWDHAGGGKIFKDEGSKFIAQEQCAANLRESPNPDVVMPDITFKSEHKVTLGGKSLHMYFFGPSHDNCLSVIQILPANLLFVADIANPPTGWHTPYNPTFSEDRVWNMVKVLTAVANLIQKEGIQTLVGGHVTTEINPQTGRPTMARGTVGPAATIAERRDFMQGAIEACRAELSSGTPAAEIPDRLVARKVLADRVLDYDPAKMRMLFTRMTDYLQTGE
jgi:glyoxylase-like metal-dependent hydrolase (beta-lactamase superfamily II)